MTSAAPTPSPTPADLAAALSAGDEARALSVVHAWGKAVPPQAIEPAADVLMRAGLWRNAHRLLNRALDPTPSVTLKQQLARNMAALQQHRPQLADELTALRPTGRFKLAATPSGLPSIIDTAPARPVMLSPHGDPRRALGESLKRLASSMGEGHCLAVFGIGDGYLLRALAENPPQLRLGLQQCVHLCVPEPEALMLAMSIHDYASPTGPIAQLRFQFHVGPQWKQRWIDQLLADPMMPVPQAYASHGDAPAGVEAAMNEVGAAMKRRLDELQHQVDTHYAALDAAELAALFGDRPPRQPRILLITSRFTTVLQHATRDTAEAFDQLRWATRILIEPSDHHRFMPIAMLAQLAEFKPDAVFVIDHLRYEYARHFPPTLPFICWVQDQLTNLTTRKAGESIGPRDYVLTAVAPMYAAAYGYPRRQMIDLPQLTRVTDPPPPTAHDTEDLVYVSNAPPPLERMIADAVDSTTAPDLRRFIEACCRRLLAVYDAGGNIATLWEMGRLIDDTARALGGALGPQARPAIIHLLTHPLNNALYRRQALRWVAAAARHTGARLSLYGNNWDQHPEFAAFARGPVAFGQPLAQLTARSRISLQILPSLCLHARMLNGLVAGGFFLVRHHPADTLIPEVARFLMTHAPHAEDLPAARAALTPEHRASFEDLLRRAECFSELGQPIDLVEWVRSIQRSQLIDERGQTLPRLSEISFHDEPTFLTLLGRFLHDDAARRSIADAQRASVAARLSYSAGMHRVTRTIAQRLAAEHA